MRLLPIACILIALIPLHAVALPTGDTQGKVAAVRVLPQVNGRNAFQVWMTDVQNDRWSCLQANGGFIAVYDNAAGTTIESYMQIFIIALSAQRSAKVLALDSGGTDPCNNINVGWMVN